MSEQIVQINFNFSGTATDYAQAYLPYAEPIGQIAGLKWKVWLMNAETHEAGGIYLFVDRVSGQAFVESPVVDGLRTDTRLRDLSVKSFDVLEPHTSRTRAAAESFVQP
jgi:hypothetical protein